MGEGVLDAGRDVSCAVGVAVAPGLEVITGGGIAGTVPGSPAVAPAGSGVAVRWEPSSVGVPEARTGVAEGANAGSGVDGELLTPRPETPELTPPATGVSAAGGVACGDAEGVAVTDGDGTGDATPAAGGLGSVGVPGTTPRCAVSPL